MEWLTPKSLNTGFKQPALLHAGGLDFTKGRWYPVTSGMIYFLQKRS
jgi:hypothetical protein